MKEAHIKALFAALILVVAGIAAWLVHGEQQKKAQLRDLAGMVGAATEQLKSALDKGPAQGDLAAASANLEALRAMDASRERALADAAEHYLISVRTVVRARGDALRLSEEAAADRRTLASMMASRRNDGWFNRTMALKKKVERDHFDLGLAYNAMDEAFDSLPNDAKRLVPMVGADAVVDPSALPAARTRMRDEAGRAAAELARIRRLPDR